VRLPIADAFRNANGYVHADSHSDGYSHGYGQRDSYCFGNAAVYADGKAASDASTAPLAEAIDFSSHPQSLQFRKTQIPLGRSSSHRFAPEDSRLTSLRAL
jgi:hypothetical protein